MHLQRLEQHFVTSNDSLWWLTSLNHARQQYLLRLTSIALKWRPGSIFHPMAQMSWHWLTDQTPLCAPPWPIADQVSIYSASCTIIMNDSLQQIVLCGIFKQLTCKVVINFFCCSSWWAFLGWCSEWKQYEAFDFFIVLAHFWGSRTMHDRGVQASLEGWAPT